MQNPTAQKPSQGVYIRTTRSGVIRPPRRLPFAPGSVPAPDQRARAAACCESQAAPRAGARRLAVSIHFPFEIRATVKGQVRSHRPARINCDSNPAIRRGVAARDEKFACVELRAKLSSTARCRAVYIMQVSESSVDPSSSIMRSILRRDRSWAQHSIAPRPVMGTGARPRFLPKRTHWPRR